MKTLSAAIALFLACVTLGNAQSLNRERIVFDPVNQPSGWEIVTQSGRTLGEDWFCFLTLLDMDHNWVEAQNGAKQRNVFNKAVYHIYLDGNPRTWHFDVSGDVKHAEITCIGQPAELPMLAGYLKLPNEPYHLGKEVPITFELNKHYPDSVIDTVKQFLQHFCGLNGFDGYDFGTLYSERIGLFSLNYIAAGTGPHRVSGPGGAPFLEPTTPGETARIDRVKCTNPR